MILGESGANRSWCPQRGAARAFGQGHVSKPSQEGGCTFVGRIRSGSRKRACAAHGRTLQKEQQVLIVHTETLIGLVLLRGWYCCGHSSSLGSDAANPTRESVLNTRWCRHGSPTQSPAPHDSRRHLPSAGHLQLSNTLACLLELISQSVVAFLEIDDVLNFLPVIAVTGAGVLRHLLFPLCFEPRLGTPQSPKLRDELLHTLLLGLHRFQEFLVLRTLLLIVLLQLAQILLLLLGKKLCRLSLRGRYAQSLNLPDLLLQRGTPGSGRLSSLLSLLGFLAQSIGANVQVTYFLHQAAKPSFFGRQGLVGFCSPCQGLIELSS
mmetsp:Transcript_72677/g.173491  ORF Transcript_72677/g.173491 Transcript_72677/m.173491 type:complete len:322 (-) Transcript_72677:1068-2033(-)